MRSSHYCTVLLLSVVISPAVFAHGERRAEASARVRVLGEAQAGTTVSASDSHVVWVQGVAKQMKSVAVGKTRADLLAIFEPTAGLKPLDHRKGTFVSRACVYFKVDAEFAAGATGGGSDMITAVSRPYVDDTVITD